MIDIVQYFCVYAMQSSVHPRFAKSEPLTSLCQNSKGCVYYIIFTKIKFQKYKV